MNAIEAGLGPDSTTFDYAEELGYSIAQAHGCKLSAQEYIDTFLAYLEINRSHSAEIHQAQANGAGRMELDAIHNKWEYKARPFEFALAA